MPLSAANRFILCVLAVLCAGNVYAAGDFPTQARVEYVLGCMEANGGQSYNTLYSCVCAIDKIDEQYTYAEFTEAEVLTFLRSTPGERGGVFRDAAPHSRERVKKLSQVREAAEKSCFLRSN